MNRQLINRMAFAAWLLWPLSSSADEPTATSNDVEEPGVSSEWYGMLNKEIRVISQRHGTDLRSIAPATEVDGNEGRVGVRGTAGFFGARIELGVNPSLDRPEAGVFQKIRIRHASIHWEHPRLGRALIGRDYLPESLATLSRDPMLPSGMGALGVDAMRQVAGYRGIVGVGYIVRPPTAQLTYESPAIHGLRLSLSYLRDDTGVEQEPEDFAEKSVVVGWKGVLLGARLNAGLFHARAISCLDDFLCRSLPTHRTQLFASVDREATSLRAMLSRERTEVLILSRLFVGASHQTAHGDWLATLAVLGYGQNDGRDIQLALGFRRALHEKVQGRIMLSIVDLDGDTNLLPGIEQNRNRAIIGLTGIMITIQ